MLETAVGRRIVGFAAALLIVASAMLLFRFAYAASPGSYEFEAILGRAGAGLGPGSDVKVRGAAVGEVTSVRYQDGRAIATLLMDRNPQVPLAGLELVVTAKTLLGEKQIELTFDDEAYGQGPFIEDGDTIAADREPTEFQEVLDELGNVLDAIDARELAVVVDAFAAQAGTEETIIGNLEKGTELADFAERTADETLERLRTFSQVADALTEAVPDLTRFGRNIRPATRILVERTADVDNGLAKLSTFAIGLAEYLEVDETLIARSLAVGDIIGAVLERNMNFVGQYISNVGIYARGFSEGGALNDGTEFAYFRILIGGDDTRAGQTPRGSWLDRLCDDAGALAALMPGCPSATPGANR
jgi:virulence factor Mce-like protein